MTLPDPSTTTLDAPASPPPLPPGEAMWLRLGNAAMEIMGRRCDIYVAHFTCLSEHEQEQSICDPCRLTRAVKGGLAGALVGTGDEAVQVESELADWAMHALEHDVPLDALADALPYTGAGEEEARHVIEKLNDAGWLIVPSPPRLREMRGEQP